MFPQQSPSHSDQAAPRDLKSVFYGDDSSTVIERQSMLGTSKNDENLLSASVLTGLNQHKLTDNYIKIEESMDDLPFKDLQDFEIKSKKKSKKKKKPAQRQASHTDQDLDDSAEGGD